MRLVSIFTINTGSFIIQLILTLSSKEFTVCFVDQVKVNVGKMKSVLLVVLLAAAATAAVVSNDVPDVMVLPVEADVDVNEGPEVLETDVLELSDLTDAAEKTAIDTQRNLSVGTISGSLVNNVQHTERGVSGQQVTKDIRINTSGRVTAVRVTNVGSSPGATVSIISGGVGSYFVTIRIRSAAGYGFNFRVQVYAS